MYQTIALGLGFLLLFGGAYLIKHTDRNGVIISSFSTSTEATSTPVVAVPADIAGTYICDIDSKCANPRILTLFENGELTMTTSYGDGVEMLQEAGTWKMDKDGGLLLVITGTNSELYETPFVLSIKKVSAISLVGNNSTGSNYKDWTNPIFRKQEKPQE